MKNDEQLRDKWMPRFHGFGAYIASILYLGTRGTFGSFPPHIAELLGSGVFKVLFIGVGLFGSIITGLAIGFYVRYKTHASMFSIKDYIEEVQTIKITYFSPYRYAILFIAVTEVFLLFN